MGGVEGDATSQIVGSFRPVVETASSASGHLGAGVRLHCGRTGKICWAGSPFMLRTVVHVLYKQYASRDLVDLDWEMIPKLNSCTPRVTFCLITWMTAYAEVWCRHQSAHSSAPISHLQLPPELASGLVLLLADLSPHVSAKGR